MSSQTSYKHILKFWLLTLLALVACQTNSRDQNNQKVKDLIREGNDLLKQEESATSEWRAEFSEFFAPEKRAAFPSNREILRPHAGNQIKLIKRRQSLQNAATEKFEQASQLSNNEKEKRFTALLAQSFRKDLEIDELFNQQMQLVFDDAVSDQKTFETKFSDITRQIQTKTNERDELQTEAKRLLGK